MPSPWLPDAVTKLSAAGTPVLLLQGAKDMTFPAILAGQAAARIPHATAVVLPDAGHMAHVDDPHAWLRAASDFLVPGADE
jgi:pimeloyl-ACP methyl ester carboxylesterase